MRIGSELIRIVCVHTECSLTAIRIECAFGQSTSIDGLKANCIIMGINAGIIYLRDRLCMETSNKERNNKRHAISSPR